MAMTFKFDLIQPHSIVQTEQGLEYTRGVLVTNIPLDPDAVSDWEVFLKVLQDDGCPGLNFPIQYPGPYQELVVKEHRLVSVARSEKSCLMNLIYRGPSLPKPDDPGGSPVIWQLDSDCQIQVIQTSMTAGGAAVIEIWYDADESDGTYSASKKVGRHVAKAAKMKSHRVLRALGWTSPSVWDTIKGDIYSIRNSINSDPWGTEPRGTWYFPGPVVTRTRGQAQLRVQLMFIEAVDGHFPLLVWHNREGKIPKDVSTEAAIRGAGPAGAPAGPPAVGQIKQRKGITLASIYDEVDFNPIFNFTPDDL